MFLSRPSKLFHSSSETDEGTRNTSNDYVQEPEEEMTPQAWSPSPLPQSSSDSSQQASADTENEFVSEPDEVPSTQEAKQPTQMESPRPAGFPNIPSPQSEIESMHGAGTPNIPAPHPEMSESHTASIPNIPSPQSNMGNMNGAGIPNIPAPHPKMSESHTASIPNIPSPQSNMGNMNGAGIPNIPAPHPEMRESRAASTPNIPSYAPRQEELSQPMERSETQNANTIKSNAFPEYSSIAPVHSHPVSDSMAKYMPASENQTHQIQRTAERTSSQLTNGQTTQRTNTDQLMDNISNIVKKVNNSPEIEANIQKVAQDISTFSKQATNTFAKVENLINNSSKYARPTPINEPKAPVPEPEPIQNDDVRPLPGEKTETTKMIEKLLGEGQKVIRAESVSSIRFADLWFTPERVAYIRDSSTKFALIPFETDDIIEFYKALEQGYTGSSSYAIKFAGEAYRVERIITLTGPQYNCRKMPRSTPDIYSLGLPEPIVKHLVSLSQEAGLILFAGPTGMGKTTTASALMRKYLENDGGFMYTIEDPPEMPLDGLYRAKNGALGLCKQCPVENERWGDGVKAALRSRPRYILVGEIRTPETASQVLRAATSGHLVLSTIHASSVEDALNSMIKYASGAGLAESLVSDLLARGILAVVHQKLEGVETLRPVLHTAFANPNPLAADQMRMTIRDGKINLGTLMEAQTSKLFQNKPLFKEL